MSLLERFLVRYIILGEIDLMNSCWYALSTNPNISAEFILKYKQMLWDWFAVKARFKNNKAIQNLDVYLLYPSTLGECDIIRDKIVKFYGEKYQWKGKVPSMEQLSKDKRFLSYDTILKTIAYHNDIITEDLLTEFFYKDMMPFNKICKYLNRYLSHDFVIKHIDKFIRYNKYYDLCKKQ